MAPAGSRFDAAAAGWLEGTGRDLCQLVDELSRRKRLPASHGLLEVLRRVQVDFESLPKVPYLEVVLDSVRPRLGSLVSRDLGIERITWARSDLDAVNALMRVFDRKRAPDADELTWLALLLHRATLSWARVDRNSLQGTPERAACRAGFRKIRRIAVEKMVPWLGALRPAELDRVAFKERALDSLSRFASDEAFTLPERTDAFRAACKMAVAPTGQDLRGDAREGITKALINLRASAPKLGLKLDAAVVAHLEGK